MLAIVRPTRPLLPVRCCGQSELRRSMQSDVERLRQDEAAQPLPSDPAKARSREAAKRLAEAFTLRDRSGGRSAAQPQPAVVFTISIDWMMIVGARDGVFIYHTRLCVSVNKGKQALHKIIGVREGGDTRGQPHCLLHSMIEVDKYVNQSPYNRRTDDRLVTLARLAGLVLIPPCACRSWSPAAAARPRRRRCGRCCGTTACSARRYWVWATRTTCCGPCGERAA